MRSRAVRPRSAGTMGRSAEMRNLLTLWFAPLAVFWGWHFLSLNDVGGIIFSRELHDRVYLIYGAILGVEPESIPGMVADALVVDSGLLFAFLAIRRRRSIAAWWQRRRGGTADLPEGPGYPRSDANLSSAP